MTTGERIRMLREQHQLSQEEIGLKLGVAKQTVFKYENDIITNIPLDKVLKLAEIMDVTPAALLGWTESCPPEVPAGFEALPQMKQVPRVGQIACGQPILAEEHIAEYDSVPAAWRADFTLVCKGDSMATQICDGDIVAIRKQSAVENGQIAAVRIGEEATLKAVYVHPNFIELRPLNPAYQSIIRMNDELDGIAVEGLAVGYWHELNI